ncbi:MAG TPA: sodium:solute symporter family protein [Woeseiaceae bacterium]|nr:sodium:solute symporter family protein [Woeseiaceae bacterium]
MIDWIIVIAFIVYSIFEGLRSRKQSSENLSEYLLAGRSVKGWRSGFSMAATQFAADTPLLVMGLIAVGGVFSLWRLWIYGLAFLLMGFVLAAAWRRAGVLTDAELTVRRYSGDGVLALRALKGIYYGTVINCVIMAFVLVAAVRIFEIFLPWHLWLDGPFYDWILGLVRATGFQLSSADPLLGVEVTTTNNVISIVTMLVFVGIYSTAGGLRSVIATDVAQFIMMIVATAAYAWFAVDSAGGIAGLPDRLVDIYGAEAADRFLSFTPAAEDAVMPFLVIVSLQWIFQMNSDGTGYLAQRSMACISDRDARIAAVTFTIAQIVVRSLFWLMIGVALLILFPFDIDTPVTDTFIGERELTFVNGMDQVLPAGLRGLMLAGMLAALASTLSTHLNWGASYWSNDLYKGVWVEKIRGKTATPAELVVVAKVSNIVVVAIALVIMVNLGSIQNAWLMSLLFGAGTGAVLLLRWLWERINLYCEIVSILISLIAAPVLLLTVEADWLQLLLMSVISTTAVVVTALRTPATDATVLVDFYRRVQPPGWWRKTAAAAGADPGEPLNRLKEFLVPLVACAISVYCWLIGAAKLLLEQDAWLFGLVVLLVGTAATPVWLRALRKSAV